MIVKTRALLLLAISVFTATASADWIANSNANAMVVLQAQAEFQPEEMARAGLTEYDGNVIDLKANYRARETATDQMLLARLNKQLPEKQDPRVRQDLQIMIQSLEDNIETRRVEEKYLLPYYDIHGFLFSSFNALLDPRNDKARYASALERLRKYNGNHEGYTPVTELARARSVERFSVPNLLGPFRGEIEKDLADAPRYIAGIRALFEEAQLQGWEDDLALLETQLAEYILWLRSDMLPRARASNLLPREVYVDNLKNYGVRAAPEQLIKDARYSYQLIRNEMKALARTVAEQRGWKDQSLLSVLQALKREQIPADQVLPLYKKRLAQIEEIIRREDVITLPDRSASIRLATEAESAAIPAPFMSPPQLINNTGQYGEFVLVQNNPALEGGAVMDDWSHDAVIWTLTLHEARPGHELQFASLVENGTSLARALFAFNSANAEGWGLYAEFIMQQYLPPEAQLFSHFALAWRAARMFLDPMVNTGQLTPEQVVEFLTGQLALSQPMASSEADRYAFRAPGQATSYYYGFRSILGLRTELEIALGNTFNPRKFHDFIIEQGLLQPSLLREAALAHFLRDGDEKQSGN